MGMSHRVPNPVTRWATGFDNDGEDTVTDIINVLWREEPGMAVLPLNAQDRFERVYDLGDYVWDEDGELLFSIKPTGTITANRYFYYGWFLTYEMPVV